MNTLTKRAVVGLGVGFSLGALVAFVPLVYASKRGAEPAETKPLAVPAEAVSAAVPSSSFAPLVSAVSPAVVSIEVETESVGPDMSVDSPFRHFMPFDGAPRRGHGLGSGFIISEDGLLLTNNHVIQSATKINARLSDGRAVEATLVGADPETDLALLKLSAEDGRRWPYVELGSSESLRVGDWVVAVGNPLGLGLTVTAGIVSGTGRSLGLAAYEDFIQTDAAINHGNSGGPLFDVNGKVVGVNTAIRENANTVGFAIPADLVSEVLGDLSTDGRVSRGYIGVNLQSLDEPLSRALKVNAPGGALVAGVSPGTPGHEAGLQDGDVIVRFADKPVADSESLRREVARHDPGEKVEMTIVRKGSEKKLSLVLAERPGGAPVAQRGLPSGEDSENSRLGVKLTPVPDTMARRIGEGGVMVAEVERDSPADGNLEPGDVITEINQSPVADPDDVKSALKGSGDLVLRVIRDGTPRYVAIPR